MNEHAKAEELAALWLTSQRSVMEQLLTLIEGGNPGGAERIMWSLHSLLSDDQKGLFLGGIISKWFAALKKPKIVGVSIPVAIEMLNMLEKIHGPEFEVRIAEASDYTVLVDQLKTLPSTWYPGILSEVVKAACDKKVFVPGGAAEFVKKVEHGHTH